MPYKFLYVFLLIFVTTNFSLGFGGFFPDGFFLRAIFIPY